jgi:hypothetical protein
MRIPQPLVGNRGTKGASVGKILRGIFPSKSKEVMRISVSTAPLVRGSVG